MAQRVRHYCKHPLWNMSKLYWCHRLWSHGRVGMIIILLVHIRKHTHTHLTLLRNCTGSSWHHDIIRPTYWFFRDHVGFRHLELFLITLFPPSWIFLDHMVFRYLEIFSLFPWVYSSAIYKVEIEHPIFPHQIMNPQLLKRGFEISHSETKFSTLKKTIP